MALEKVDAVRDQAKSFFVIDGVYFNQCVMVQINLNADDVLICIIMIYVTEFFLLREFLSSFVHCSNRICIFVYTACMLTIVLRMALESRMEVFYIQLYVSSIIFLPGHPRLFKLVTIEVGF